MISVTQHFQWILTALELSHRIATGGAYETAPTVQYALREFYAVTINTAPSCLFTFLLTLNGFMFETL